VVFDGDREKENEVSGHRGNSAEQGWTRGNNRFLDEVGRVRGAIKDGDADH